MEFGRGNPKFLRSRSWSDIRQDFFNYQMPKFPNFDSDDEEETSSLAGLFGASKVHHKLGIEPRRADSRPIKLMKEPLTVKFGEINITLKQGIFYEEEVDAVVNITSGSLNLSSWQASRALLEKAGASMQEECQQKYPEGIKVGEIAETGGHALYCGYVFHVVLLCWKQENQVFLDVIRKVLQKCDEYQLSSIAIPLIGTGFLNFTSGTVAKLLLLAIQNYGKANKASVLTQVRFVIREEDIKHYEDFETEMRKFSNTNMQTPDQKKHMPKGKGPPVPRGVRKMVGRVKVDLIRGSITDQKVDVLVNVTNEGLQLNEGALSRAILKAAGSNLQQECCNSYPKGVDIGDVASTSAFELKNVKAIYHTALPVYDRSQGDSQDMNVHVLVQRCLSVASEEKRESIAFPTVGCGYQGFPSMSAAKIIASAIVDFCEKNPTTSLKKIVVVVFGGHQNWRVLWKPFQTEWEKLGSKNLAGAKKPPAQEVKPGPAPVSHTPKRGSTEWFKMKYEEDICVPLY